MTQLKNCVKLKCPLCRIVSSDLFTAHHN